MHKSWMPFYQEYYRKNTLEVQENTTVVSSKSTYLLNEVSFLSYQAFTISPPPNSLFDLSLCFSECKILELLGDIYFRCRFLGCVSEPLNQNVWKHEIPLLFIYFFLSPLGTSPDRKCEIEIVYIPLPG